MEHLVSSIFWQLSYCLMVRKLYCYLSLKWRNLQLFVDVGLSAYLQPETSYSLISLSSREQSCELCSILIFWIFFCVCIGLNCVQPAKDFLLFDWEVNMETSRSVDVRPLRLAVFQVERTESIWVFWAILIHLTVKIS